MFEKFLVKVVISNCNCVAELNVDIGDKTCNLGFLVCYHCFKCLPAMQRFPPLKY